MPKTLTDGLNELLYKRAASGPFNNSLISGLTKYVNDNGLAGPALGLAGLATAGSIASGGGNEVAKIISDRYQKMNEPTWKAMGEAKLYQDNPELINYQKAQEALLKLKYEAPITVGTDIAEKAIGGLGSNVAGMLEEAKARNAFDQISSSPIVQALGKEKARNIYDQLTAIAPQLVRKAPGTALAVMARSMDEGAGAATIDPNMAMSLTRSASELAKI